MAIIDHFADERSIFATRFMSRFPRRLKRMIYISSLFGLIIEDQKIVDMGLMQELNAIIELTRDYRSTELPIRVRRTIWKNLDVTQMNINGNESISLTDVIRKTLSTDDCAAIGEQIAKRVPDWLKYGSVAVMANDVIILIKQLRKIRGTRLVQA